MTGVSLNGRLIIILIATMAFQILVSAWQLQWSQLVLSCSITGSTVAGLALAKHWRLFIPSGLKLVLVVLVFMWLFLGYVHDYYDRFSWWDNALHLYASAIVSVMAFLLVHVFNRSDEFGSRTRPGLVAVFAVVFAVAIGAFWEIFEFAVDRIFGADMQDAMLGDETGLTDTMADLIADTIGALSVAVYGYYHLKKPQRASVLKHWVNTFIRGNPRLFGRAH